MVRRTGFLKSAVLETAEGGKENGDLGETAREYHKENFPTPVLPTFDHTCFFAEFLIYEKTHHCAAPKRR
jgi:hypothetical protein